MAKNTRANPSSTKLVAFEGKIDFKKDSPAKISSTLANLENYLKTFEENDAAQIVENFKGLASSKNAQDKSFGKKFLKAYEKRTEHLKSLTNYIKKIQEDLVDEQDTTVKKAPVKKGSFVFKKLKKAKNLAASATKTPMKLGGDLMGLLGKVGGLAGKIFSGLLNFKSWLPLLATSAIGLVVKSLKGIGKAIVNVAIKSIGKVAKLVYKSFGFIIKNSVKAVKGVFKFASKLASKGFKLVTSWFKRIGLAIVGWVGTGLKNLAGFFGKMFKKLKFWESAADAARTKKKVDTPNDIKKQSQGKPGNVKGSPKSPSQKLPNDSKGWLSKVDEAWNGVKTKVIPNLEKVGAKKLVGAFAKGMAKAATKAIPIIGWGLLAYDAYNAGVKSDSLMSFGVNLLDEASGGLLSAAVSTPEGVSLGQYVEALAGMRDDIDVSKSPDAEKVGVNSTSIGSVLSNIAVDTANIANTVSMAGGAMNVEDSGAQTKPNQDKTTDLQTEDDYIRWVSANVSDPVARGRLIQVIKSGSITEKNAVFNYIQNQHNSVQGTPVSKNVEISSVQAAQMVMVKDAAVAEAVGAAAAMNLSTIESTKEAMQTMYNSTQTQIGIKNVTNIGEKRTSVQG